MSVGRRDGAPWLRWWHALPFWLLVNAYSLFFREGGGEILFEGFRPAPWAPPSIAFPIVWFSLNVLQIWVLWRLLKADPDWPRRAPLLAIQAVCWAIYATFALVYFTLTSPILGAVWTLSFAVLTLASIALALPDDRRTALLLAPHAAWTLFASTAAVWQAVVNPDPLLGYMP